MHGFCTETELVLLLVCWTGTAGRFVFLPSVPVVLFASSAGRRSPFVSVFVFHSRWTVKSFEVCDSNTC